MVLVFQLNNGKYFPSILNMHWLDCSPGVYSAMHSTHERPKMLLNCLLESWMGRSQIREEVL